MTFPNNVAEMALLLCGRCCCLCHKFCGTKIELHHISQQAKGGADTLENCIPLCFNCHAEATQYNFDHPKGRRFTPSELKRHRDAWFANVKSLNDQTEVVPGAQYQTVKGNRNVVAGGDVNIAARITKRNEVVPDPGGRHITEAEAFQIKTAVDKYSNLMKEAGLNPSPGSVWSKLYKYFKVPSYREIPFGHCEEAISLVQIETAKARPKLRRRNPQAWRNQYYAAIWAAAKNIGMEKADVYMFAFQRLGLTRPISSLTSLSQKQLQELDRKLKERKTSLE
jgi:hypothetical protein